MTQIARSRYGYMEASAAKPAFEVHGPASIHITDEPQKPGTILDAHEQPITVKKGLMARIDEKGSESVTLRKSTLWFAGTALVLFQVLFNYGSSLFGWVRDDEAGRVQRANIERQVEELNRKFDDIQKTLQVQAIRDAEKRGYELKSAEGDHGKEKK